MKRVPLKGAYSFVQGITWEQSKQPELIDFSKTFLKKIGRIKNLIPRIESSGRTHPTLHREVMNIPFTKSF
ncbi:hypothetical protein EUGRSUZ_E00243 [Eucalyptus grandis]|uniref:Uncharacterized protein n=2 Tax=Eucalyptus grandis TaxID=71139 RepID=A0ACC3KT89_EUCGR|nr:hypothetical protein EUGRSUZ_E00243 [Eucalyptus grandis]